MNDKADADDGEHESYQGHALVVAADLEGMFTTILGTVGRVIPAEMGGPLLSAAVSSVVEVFLYSSIRGGAADHPRAVAELHKMIDVYADHFLAKYPEMAGGAPAN